MLTNDIRSMITAVRWGKLDVYMKAKILHTCGIPWLLCTLFIKGLEIDDIPVGSRKDLDMFK